MARIDELLDEPEILTKLAHRRRSAAAGLPCGRSTPFDSEEKPDDN